MQLKEELEDDLNKIRNNQDYITVDSSNVSIAIYVLLLISTFFASDMFGIPEYFAFNICDYTTRFKFGPLKSFELFLYGIFLLFAFIFIQIKDASLYFILLFKNMSKYTITGNFNVLKQTADLTKERNALKSLTSLSIAICWILGLYVTLINKPTTKKEEQELTESGMPS
jgi:hypothetical protein